MYTLRIQIWWWIKKQGISRKGRTEKLLGYTFEEFCTQIGKPLNGQHLDHKIPISWFNADTPIELVFSLDNLHYITGTENQTKSNLYAHDVPQEYKNKIKKHIKIKYQSKLWT